MKKFLSNINRFFYILWAVIIALALIFAVRQHFYTGRQYQLNDDTRISFLSNDYSQPPIAFDENAGKSVKNEKLDPAGGFDAERLFGDSDLVVKVTATNDRKLKFDSFLTRVTVERVYKGDKSLLKRDIYVYEWATAFMYNHMNKRDGEFIYESRDTYNVMCENEEYYLFLSRCKMPEGYRYDETEQRTFLLTNVHYGKYNVETCRELHVLPKVNFYWDSELTYKDIKYFDIMTTKQAALDDYMARREKAVKMLEEIGAADRT